MFLVYFNKQLYSWRLIQNEILIRLNAMLSYTSSSNKMSQLSFLNNIIYGEKLQMSHRVWTSFEIVE